MLQNPNVFVRAMPKRNIESWEKDGKSGEDHAEMPSFKAVRLQLPPWAAYSRELCMVANILEGGFFSGRKPSALFFPS